MQLSNVWMAYADDTDMGMVVVRGRMHMDAVRLSGDFNIRVEMQWLIQGDDKGAPTDVESEVIERVMSIVCDAVERGNVAVLTAIHTGARQVRYIFYATSIDAFSQSVQPLLQRLGNLPLHIAAVVDENWSDYTSMIARQAMT